MPPAIERISHLIHDLEEHRRFKQSIPAFVREASLLSLLAYVREVAARTEQYWCPIKHARPAPAPHRHYQQFLDYGDARGYRRELPAIRRALARRQM